MLLLLLFIFHSIIMKKRHENIRESINLNFYLNLLSSHIIHVQQKISNRAIELLNLPKKRSYMLLDIGCGSGLSGEMLDQIPNSSWVGVDISPAMLNVALQREIEGDLARSDIGEGLPFRTGTFDGAVSISTIQWLFNADFKDAVPQRRIRLFFKSLNRCLVKGGRAVLQYYPESHTHHQELLNAATLAGFGGGWLCDYPNSTRQKKFCLFFFLWDVK
jgi:18S rRNA (guanine1575-N7)-methyltransferase